jgi:hypothetical protein
MVNFDRFPHKNQELLPKWIEAVGRRNWFPSKKSCFAEIIFATSTLFFLRIRPTIYKKKILKKDAVPSIFKEILQKLIAALLNTIPTCL